MNFSTFLDPLNWSFRYYLIEAIEATEFDQNNPEGSWQQIIEKVQFLSRSFLEIDFKIDVNDCKLMYLQLLAEFGDFRSLADPFSPPSEEIKAKIREMRRSELRHQLLITNNQIRYNNYVLKHHKMQAVSQKNMKWIRAYNPNEEHKNENEIQNILSQIVIASKSEEWFSNLPQNGKGSIGLKDMCIDNIITRTINGIVTTPIELLRDIVHLVTNLYLDAYQLTDKQKEAIQKMNDFFVSHLKPYIIDDDRYKNNEVIMEILQVPLVFPENDKKDKKK